MQDREIRVNIKTLDDKHCYSKCKKKNAWYPPHCIACITTKRPIMLKYDSVGYLRTKQCIESEIKKGKE